MKRLSVLLVALAVLAIHPSVASSKADKVEISGRAYAFNHMDTFIAGATVRVREFPKLKATTNATGDYSLEVPIGVNVTPYIVPPEGYNEIDLQTFHTRVESIENANFQVPADFEYGALAAILSVPIGNDGRPEECVIVTTASARNVRGVDYETFEKRTPHGVAGATARTYPKLPGPTYFNENVIPDSTETETSEDGGMIWTGVRAGTYRIVASHPKARFASFLATCEPGRIVNANPPWGTYELKRNEQPLGASVVAGSVGSARLVPKRGRDIVRFTVDAAERLEVRARLEGEGGRRTGVKKMTIRKPGSATLRMPAPAWVFDGLPSLNADLIDAAGDRVDGFDVVSVPADG